MPKLMDMGITRLTSLLLQMAELAEKSVAASIDAYSNMSSPQESAHQIRSWSEELRKSEDDATEIALELIARFQPVAGDLRFIKAAMEISYGFSRLGRYAYDIAEVLEMFGDLSECDLEVVGVTANATKEMIRMSIDALAKRDVELAKKVKKMDDFVDNQYREHVAYMLRSGNAMSLKCASSATLILRYLERMSDHAGYIGDSVIYIVAGEKENWKLQKRSILAESKEE